MSREYQLICFNCKRSEENSINSCSFCDGPLYLKYFVKKGEARIIKKEFGLSPDKLTEFLPIKGYKNLSMFKTPLIFCQKLSRKYKTKIYAKLELLNLTNSIKDRQARVEAIMAKELGYNTLVAASTGNLAGSLSVFCQKVGIKCIIYIPKTTSIAKLSQIKSYGGIVYEIKGNYDEALKEAKKDASSNNYFLGGIQAFRYQGYKTIAYEILDQIHFVPDYIIVPVGDGTTLVGIYEGFKDLHNSGMTDKLPKMVGVQEDGNNPVFHVLRKTKGRKKDGIARAIHVNLPLELNYLVDLLKSKETCISVSSREIINATEELAMKEGIYSEYASSATLAALKKIQKETKDKSVLLIISGNGLKN